MLKPTPRNDGIWRWGLWEIIVFRWGHEGGALMLALVSLKKRMRQKSSPYFSASTHQRKATWGHKQEECSQQEPNQLAPRSQIFQTVRNKCYLPPPSQAVVIYYNSPSWLGSLAHWLLHNRCSANVLTGQGLSHLQINSGPIISLEIHFQHLL